jgi:hypothetical protein
MRYPRLPSTKTVASVFIPFLFAIACEDTVTLSCPAGRDCSFATENLSIEIPGAAVPSGGLDLTAARVSSPPAAPSLIAATAWDLGPDGTTFSPRAKLTVSYAGLDLQSVGVRPEELGIYKATGASWQRVDSMLVNSTNQTVSAWLATLSIYGILGVPVDTLVVSAAPSTNVQVGNTTQLTGEARAGSMPLPDRPVSWSSSANAIATVSPLGVVQGVSVGQVTVTGSSQGKSTVVSITVQPAGPASTVEPTFTLGVDTSMYFEDFESYASTTAFRNAYATREIGGSIALDATVAMAGTKSFRADFVGGCLGNNDAAVLIERSLPANQPTDRDWVFQWHSRSPGFKFRWDNFADCPRGGGNKELVLFRDPANNDGKFTFGQAGATAPECPAIYTPPPAFSLWIFFQEADAGATQPAACSGRQQITMQHLAAGTKAPNLITDDTWHRLTMRLKKESGKDVGDGIVQFWIDGVLVMNYNGEDSSSPAFRRVYTRTLPMGRIFQYPGTVNGGAPQNQSRWFDNVRYWVERGS